MGVPDIDRTVLERGALGLAPCEESHGMPVDEGQILQVQRFPLPCFGVDDPLQLGDVLDADSTTHGEDHEGAPHRSLDPQHRCPSRGGANFDSAECTSRSVRNRGASRNYAKTLERGGCRVTTLRKFPKCRNDGGDWTPRVPRLSTVRGGPPPVRVRGGDHVPARRERRERVRRLHLTWSRGLT